MNHNPTPEKIVFLFVNQPPGYAKITGTPIASKKDKAMNNQRDNWNKRVIEQTSLIYVKSLKRILFIIKINQIYLMLLR